MSKRIKRRIGMRRRVTTGLNTGSMITCADNTGARKLKLIQVMGYKGVRRRQPPAGIGDLIVVSCREGTPEMRRQIFNAVVIRQRKIYPRRDGTWVQFDDNAAVILTPDGEIRGSDIKGPVAKEAVERWPRLNQVARMVV